MIKLLIGGSPCTDWSIAKKDRETEPKGKGWELFKNYWIAKQKFCPGGDAFQVRQPDWKLN